MSEPLPAIAYDLFSKIDLRVATVLAAEAHPNADKLLKLKLDDGTPEGRQVCAGVRAWYDPATLVGKQVVIVANLEPRMLRGEVSAGMILAASDLKADAVIGRREQQPGAPAPGGGPLSPIPASAMSRTRCAKTTARPSAFCATSTEQSRLA